MLKEGIENLTQWYVQLYLQWASRQCGCQSSKGESLLNVSRYSLHTRHVTVTQSTAGTGTDTQDNWISPQSYHQLVRDTGHRYPQCYGVYRHQYPQCYYVYKNQSLQCYYRTTVAIVLTQTSLDHGEKVGQIKEKQIIVSRLCMVSSCLKVRLSGGDDEGISLVK